MKLKSFPTKPYCINLHASVIDTFNGWWSHHQVVHFTWTFYVSHHRTRVKLKSAVHTYAQSQKQNQQNIRFHGKEDLSWQCHVKLCQWYQSDAGFPVITQKLAHTIKNIYIYIYIYDFTHPNGTQYYTILKKMVLAIGLGYHVPDTHTIANLLWWVSFMAHLICYGGILPSEWCGFFGHCSKTRTHNIAK